MSWVLINTVPFSTHSICFSFKIQNIILSYLINSYVMAHEFDVALAHIDNSASSENCMHVLAFVILSYLDVQHQNPSNKHFFAVSLTICTIGYF